MPARNVCPSRNEAFGLALLAALVACNTDRIIEPDGAANPGTPQSQVIDLLVSAPTSVPSAQLYAARAAVGGGEAYAFVSAPPGTVDGASAVISNRTRDRLGQGDRIEVSISDRGFDPVPIPASAGDTLQIEFRAADQSVLLIGVVAVPTLRPPAVVRTSPRGGKKDVALNARLEIVFSEPIDPATITSDNVQVTAGGLAIAGQPQLTNEFTVEFVPVQSLNPETVYQIVVRSAIRNVNGVPLAGDFSATFETVPASSPPPAPTPSLCSDSGECFAFSRGDAVYTSTLDGAPERLLIDDAIRPAWSPDGTTIAFTRPTRSTVEKWQICLAESDGTRVRCVVGAEDGYLYGDPSWSPDGTEIAFSVVFPDCSGAQCEHRRYFAYSADTAYFSSVRVLNTRTMQVTSVQAFQVMRVAFSPDGRQLAFAAYYSGSLLRAGLHVMNRDGSNVRYLGDGLGEYAPGDFGSGIAWSPEGDRLALSLLNACNFPRTCIYALGLVGVDGTGMQVLVTENEMLDPSARFIVTPAWSPDGSRLAYTLLGPCTESGGCVGEIRAWDFKAGNSYLLVSNGIGGSWRP